MTNTEEFTQKQRIVRLRAAGLSTPEIGEAVKLSHQRVAQILAAEPPIEWDAVKLWVDQGQCLVVVDGDVDVRILHASIKQHFLRLGKEVSEEPKPGVLPVGHPRWEAAVRKEEAGG